MGDCELVTLSLNAQIRIMVVTNGTLLLQMQSCSVSLVGRPLWRFRHIEAMMGEPMPKFSSLQIARRCKLRIFFPSSSPVGHSLLLFSQTRSGIPRLAPVNYMPGFVL